MPADIVTAPAFAATEGVADWRFMLRQLHTTFRAGSFPAAAALIAAIADEAERQDHHPEVDLRYPDRVHVSITSHDVADITSRDVRLARAISQLAAAKGATAEPGSAEVLEIAIDTMDAERIRAFWAAVLDYRERGEVLVDPRGIGPRLWFQEMDAPRPQRNRIHLDLNVPHDVAEQRVAAAIAAGGVLVSDARARAFWVLADADGNEVCVCTWQDRQPA